MEKALNKLLNDLEFIATTHREVLDTYVREKMFEAIHDCFIKPKADYELPVAFGMFTEDGNHKVYLALRNFLTHPEVMKAAQTLSTPASRLAAFQNMNVLSKGGNTFDEYFGYADHP